MPIEIPFTPYVPDPEPSVWCPTCGGRYFTAGHAASQRHVVAEGIVRGPLLEPPRGRRGA